MQHKYENESTQQCPLCKKDAATANDPEHGLMRFRCARCGTFEVSKEAMILSLPDQENLHLLSGVTREHCERYRKPILIPSENTKELRSRAPADGDVPEKAKRLLLGLKRMTEYPGQVVTCVGDKDYPLGYCRNDEEFDFLIRHLARQNLLQGFAPSSSGYFACISPGGWAAIESFKKPNIESDKVFVAMWINSEMDEAYGKGMQPAIEDDCGYKAIRIDTKDFLGDIVDEIIAEIRESRFIVADVTRQRQGVYFEAGYAQGMGLPVVWTCHEEEIGKVHFDTRQQNHIVWTSPEDLRKRLANRIRAVIGLGPHKTRSEAP